MKNPKHKSRAGRLLELMVRLGRARDRALADIEAGLREAERIDPGWGRGFRADQVADASLAIDSALGTLAAEYARLAPQTTGTRLRIATPN